MKTAFFSLLALGISAVVMAYPALAQNIIRCAQITEEVKGYVEDLEMHIRDYDKSQDAALNLKGANCKLATEFICDMHYDRKRSEAGAHYQAFERAVEAIPSWIEDGRSLNCLSSENYDAIERTVVNLIADMRRRPKP